MRKVFPSLLACFTIGLLCVGVPSAHAKPKAVTPHQTLMQQLTQEEIACRAGGILVELIAVDRDDRVPLTTTIARLRMILSTSSPEYAKGMVELAQQIYVGAMSGPDLRQLFEITCLDPKGHY